MKRQALHPIPEEILKRLKKVRLRQLPRQQEKELKLVALIVLDTGLHPSDVIALDWKHAAFEDGGLVCQDAEFGALVGPLEDSISQHLARSLKRDTAGGRVFRHLTDDSVHSFFDLIERIRASDHMLMKRGLLALNMLAS